jgi:hypothetical protein
MITIDEIKARRKRILDSQKDMEKRELSAARKDMECFKYCILYLEGNPSEDFVKKQLKEVQTRLKKIKDGQMAWISSHRKSGQTDTQAKAFHAATFETKKMTLQIKYLNFILKN